MKVDTKLFSMQVTVPHSVYGSCSYWMPSAMSAWLKTLDAIGTYTGVDHNGDGYTDWESVYMVRNIRKEDALVFKVMFPQCRVHVSEQYEYV